MANEIERILATLDRDYRNDSDPTFETLRQTVVELAPLYNDPPEYLTASGQVLIANVLDVIAVELDVELPEPEAHT